MVIVIETRGLNGADLADHISLVQQQLREGFTCGEGWWIEDSGLRRE